MPQFRFFSVENNSFYMNFRSAVIVVIAIERMKYIVRRWQTGKRVGGEAIFSHHLPRFVAIVLCLISSINEALLFCRRSASASTNNWVRSEMPYMAGQSPPCRDRPPFQSGRQSLLNMPVSRPLQAPALIAECSERLENLSSGLRPNPWS